MLRDPARSAVSAEVAVGCREGLVQQSVSPGAREREDHEGPEDADKPMAFAY
ncbi:hypothetical protein [Streptomyces sp. NPDC056682]|uniref:hypothetical protein n=1 Tax=Streptomyces sp. NPDC056682 TaxID=3345909 RepID=UPI00368F4E4C